MTCGGTLPVWLDCSPEAQEARKRLLQSLTAKQAGGVASIADRGRSVSYRSAADMSKTIDDLKREYVACATGRMPGKQRLDYIDYVKGL
jgi:hypothetical protein